MIAELRIKALMKFSVMAERGIAKDIVTILNHSLEW